MKMVANNTGDDVETVRRVLAGFVEVVTLCVQLDEEVKIPEFGKFVPRVRDYRNPLDPLAAGPARRRFVLWQPTPLFKKRTQTVNES